MSSRLTIHSTPLITYAWPSTIRLSLSGGALLVTAHQEKDTPIPRARSGMNTGIAAS
jgi:hypothetical protein